MVSSFDEVLPLASFIAGNLFEPVQNAFIDCVTSNLREYHRIMNEVKIDSYYQLLRTIKIK